MSDPRQLVDSVLNGDRAAFETLVRQHEKLVGQIVARMVKNSRDHEDLCQDIFIKVYRNLGSFQFKAKLSTWIAQIAYNRCINYLQKRKVAVFGDRDLESDQEPNEDQYSNDDPGPDATAEQQDLSERVRSLIGTLPAAQRTVITLYHLQDMSYNEIGKIMNIPAGTVKSHLFRARKKLKEILMARYELEEIWN